MRDTKRISLAQKLRTLAVALAYLVMLSFAIYTVRGYWDARNHAGELVHAANQLKAEGYDIIGLGKERSAWLILLEDPGFWQHKGVDVVSRGAGITTITQSLSKRLGFESFKPGMSKLRQTGYALGLESILTKDQILALYLDTVPMGRDQRNQWIDGFFRASDAVFGTTPDSITDAQFIRLISVLIAPSNLSMWNDKDTETAIRVDRVHRLIAGECNAQSAFDVWLEGCD